MDAKTFVEKSIGAKSKKFIEISDLIWGYAEGGYQEFKSQALLCKALEEEGFEVETNLVDIPTSFKGVWGSGYPVIGLLGEYDALPGLSQIGASPVKEELVEKGRGHGCGHNMLGTGCLAAAVAIKEYLEETKQSGTVIYFGTPAEESGAGKAFMARDGAFDGVDFFYTWHPSTTTDVMNAHFVGNFNKVYSFKGITAHAGGAPHLGRSALDSVELMNVGSNYLREHVIPEARIHYAYLDVGGEAPNIVQDRASIRYVCRAPYTSQIREISERIDNIAKGAALMSGTTVEWQLQSSYAEYIPNEVLALVASEAMEEIGAPEWDEADYELAKAFDETISPNSKDAEVKLISERYGKDQVESILEKPLDTKACAYNKNVRKIVTGSTDVGDVGYIAPTVMISVATESLGTPGHSWQMTGQGKSSIGHKGMLTAGKIMALASIKMLENPDKIKEAQAEFMEKNNGVYDCPLDKSIKAPEYI